MILFLSLHRILIYIQMLIFFGAKYVHIHFINAIMLIHLQEEPLNNGAWSYVGPRIYTAASQTQYHKGKYPYYAGRGPTSSVATGSKVRLLQVIPSCY